MHSRLYVGQVKHRRYTPVPHAFQYALFMLYLDLDERPAVGDSSVVALGQAGVGLKFGVGSKKALRLEYRFQHVSDPFDSNDHGWNYHCFVLGISWLKY